jgi:hypothetical protein
MSLASLPHGAKRNRANSHQITQHFHTTFRLPEYNLVKSGKFGPEIEEYTMPLPTYYPKFTTDAKHALRAGLVEYEEKLQKLTKKKVHCG